MFLQFGMLIELLEKRLTGSYDPENHRLAIPFLYVPSLALVISWSVFQFYKEVFMVN